MRYYTISMLLYSVCAVCAQDQSKEDQSRIDSITQYAMVDSISLKLFTLTMIVQNVKGEQTDEYYRVMKSSINADLVALKGNLDDNRTANGKLQFSKVTESALEGLYNTAKDRPRYGIDLDTIQHIIKTYSVR